MNPLRVIFCSSGGAFGAAVLQQLLTCESIRIAGVVASSRILRAGYSPVRGAYAQIRLSGLRYALYLWSATRLADAVLMLSGRRSITGLARHHCIPHSVTSDINGEQEQQWLRRIQPDLLISAFFNQRVGAAVLALPCCGAVNIHPARLPDGKGVDPVFFARLRGEDRLGVTVHRMDQGFDTGPALSVEAMPLIASESLFASNLRLFQHGAELLIRDIDRIAEGAPGTPQPADGSYDSWPTPGDVARLHRSGTRLVRWSDFHALLTTRRTSG